MRILGIETSSGVLGVALMENGVLVAAYTRNGTLQHSQALMPAVERLLDEQGWTIKDIDLVAVDVGPGSFTGVRIGVSAANAIAYAAGIPVVGIDSLETLKENVSVYPGHICVLIDARNENIYAARYEGGMCVAPPEATVLTEYIKDMPQETLFVGDGAVAYREMIIALLPKARFAQAEMNLCRADALCAIAQRRRSESDGENGQLNETVLPLYLRPSQAERLYQERKQN